MEQATAAPAETAGDSSEQTQAGTASSGVTDNATAESTTEALTGTTESTE